MKTPSAKQSSEGGYQYTGYRHGFDEAEIVAAAHDGGDGVEHPG